jgi:hypothetical protein
VNDYPSSGNRWERPEERPEESTAPITPDAAAPPAQPVVPPETTVPPPPPGRNGPRSWVKDTRVRFGAAGAAIFLVGGAAGAGLAHVVADDGTTVPTRGPGFTSDDHHGFDDRHFGGPDGGEGGQVDPQGQTDEGSGT